MNERHADFLAGGRMQARITKRLVDQLNPGDADSVVFDTALKGFVLRIGKSGVKSYQIRYRMGGRATPLVSFTIGRHGSPWTAEQARTEAERLLRLVGQGIDPRAEKRAREARGVTVDELGERYLAEHVEIKNKASTHREARRLVEKVIAPRLGNITVAALSRADVATFHHRLRETPRVANQALAVLSKMFSLAELWGLRPDGTNPVKRIERYRENKRERFLSDAEMIAVGKVLAEAEEKRLAPDAPLAALRLLLLTGCRLGEILALRWEDVDLESGALIIRDGKAGGRVHSIGATTMAFLAELPRLGVYVVGSVRDPNKPMSQSTMGHVWIRLRGKAGLEDVRIHDLRHTVGTYAGQTGANAFLVRDKLGHKTLAMTGRYVNRDAHPLRVLSDAVEGRIGAALEAGRAESQTAEVVDLAAVRKGGA